MLQLWIEADPDGDVVEMVNGDDPRLRRIAVLDAILNNTDRKAGHLLPIPGGHLHAVDHGVTFSIDPKLRTVLWAWEGEPFDAEEAAGLARVRAALGTREAPGPLAAALAELLFVDEIDATRARIDDLLAVGPLPEPESRVARDPLAPVLRDAPGGPDGATLPDDTGRGATPQSWAITEARHAVFSRISLGGCQPAAISAFAARSQWPSGADRFAMAPSVSSRIRQPSRNAARGVLPLRHDSAWEASAQMGGAADHALAIDVGTQSVRAIQFDPAGNLVAMGRVPIEPYVSPQPGWAEQDPEVWWTAIGEACRRLWAEPGADASAIAGVALTTQRVTLVVADEDGTPLRPAIVWLDQRRTEGLKPVGGLWGAAFRVAGVARPSRASRPTRRRTGSSATNPPCGSGSVATASCRPG